jgi:hypothetical protein
VRDFKLKLILSVLSGVFFSFIFILLAFALPISDNDNIIEAKPEGKLGQISHGLRK